jgi:hypothetical protein
MGASSHSGRRPLTTRLAGRGIELKLIAQIAGPVPPENLIRGGFAQ